MLTIEEKFLSHYYELRRSHGEVSIREIANLAVILRQFLKDKFIHTINKSIESRQKFRFPVDRNQDQISENYIFLADYLSVAQPISGATTIEIKSFDEFLAFKILCVSNKQFSVSDLIDIVANKMGNAHYNPAEAIALGLDPFDQRTNLAIKNSILRISKSVVKACEDLAKHVLPISYVNCIGHWDADDSWAGNTHLIHNGGQWMETALSITQATKGLSVFLAAKLMPINRLSSVILSIELNKGDRINLSYDWKGNLFLNFYFRGEKRSVSFETAEPWGTIGNICVYAIHLEALEDCVSGNFSIIFKGRKIFDENFGDSVNSFSFSPDRIVIGADHLGANGATMKNHELALFLCDSGNEVDVFRRYMIAKYELA